MTLNDFECAIHLKVRLVDVPYTKRTWRRLRTLWLSDSTIRIGVARLPEGAEGEWAEVEGLAPSMWAADALFLCGSWASCSYCNYIHTHQ